MAQIFHPGTNTIARVSIFGGVFIVGALLYVTYEVIRSPYQTAVNVVREQPVQFSHEHHVRGLGIDCRYCHTSVESSSFAGIPPTETCMTCHSQVWNQSPMLEPVRASYREDRPIVWNRVHDLPDFVYFHHGIHVQKGIGCSTCHGHIEKMPLTWKAEPMTMEWCLGCHRQPEKYLRPTSEIFNMNWTPGPNQLAEGRALAEAEHVPLDGGPMKRLTNCSVCHR